MQVGSSFCDCSPPKTDVSRIFERPTKAKLAAKRQSSCVARELLNLLELATLSINPSKSARVRNSATTGDRHKVLASEALISLRRRHRRWESTSRCRQWPSRPPSCGRVGGTQSTHITRSSMLHRKSIEMASILIDQSCNERRASSGEQSCSHHARSQDTKTRCSPSTIRLHPRRDRGHEYCPYTRCCAVRNIHCKWRFLVGFHELGTKKCICRLAPKCDALRTNGQAHGLVIIQKGDCQSSFLRPKTNSFPAW